MEKRLHGLEALPGSCCAEHSRREYSILKLHARAPVLLYIHNGYTHNGHVIMTPKRTVAATEGGELTPAMFHILLTLAEGERHGYAIMQEIERRTNGVVELGPGTLYRSIKQLVSGGLIAEVESQPNGTKQRRDYRLTPEGKRRAVMEAQRLQGLVAWAETARLLHGGPA
jgi:DNA-binding MarR family transcriptional regulator